jgi:hypothetical protein
LEAPTPIAAFQYKSDWHWTRTSDGSIRWDNPETNEHMASGRTPDPELSRLVATATFHVELDRHPYQPRAVFSLLRPAKTKLIRHLSLRETHTCEYQPCLLPILLQMQDLVSISHFNDTLDASSEARLKKQGILQDLGRSSQWVGVSIHNYLALDADRSELVDHLQANALRLGEKASLVHDSLGARQNLTVISLIPRPGLRWLTVPIAESHL